MTNRYSDDPVCRLCYHPKVVHRGATHVGECAALDCPYECRAFVSMATGLPAAPDKGEQTAHLSNQITGSGDVADA
jgi:hypothetical protein